MKILIYRARRSLEECVFYAGVAATKYFKKLSMKPSFTSGLGESDMNDVWIGTFQLIWNDAMKRNFWLHFASNSDY